jgi:hypothetical protein
MTKIFIFIGIIFIIIGLILYFFKDFPLFHLPGDIVIEKENFTFYFPITSSILISIVLSAIFYILSRFMQ